MMWLQDIGKIGLFGGAELRASKPNRTFGAELTRQIMRSVHARCRSSRSAAPSSALC